MKRKELGIYIVLWLLVFAVQFYIFPESDPRYHQRVFISCFHLIPLLLAFFINNLVTVPRYLFHKKYWQYIISTLGLIVVLVVFSAFGGMLIRNLIDLPPLPGGPLNGGPGIFGSRGVPVKPFHVIILENILLLVLTLGFGTSIKLIFRWLQEEGRRKELEKEQLKTELSMLQQQVSPHFLMNTLNNIHALVDINPALAKDTIIELSKLMQYLLYESSKGITTIQKEAGFIRSYVNLMGLRFPEKVKINLEISSVLPERNIPPMLFTSLIENAFKHGISYEEDSFVNIKLFMEDTRLIFWISNSNHHKHKKMENKNSGLGLINIKKTLDLLYPDKYLFEINDNKNSFDVYLNIPMNEN